MIITRIYIFIYIISTLTTACIYLPTNFHWQELYLHNRAAAQELQTLHHQPNPARRRPGSHLRGNVRIGYRIMTTLITSFVRIIYVLTWIFLHMHQITWCIIHMHVQSHVHIVHNNFQSGNTTVEHTFLWSYWNPHDTQQKKLQKTLPFEVFLTSHRSSLKCSTCGPNTRI